VIPCYNAATWLGDTLASVAAQGAVVTEVVVVDDGSEDDSVGVATRAGLTSLRIIRQAHLGASRARTAGTAATTAPLVQYLDADDVLMPGTLAARIAALDGTDADIAYTDFVRWEQQPDGSFREGAWQRRELGSRPDVEILVDAWWPPGALLYRRTLVDRVLPWREDLPVIQDARFLLDAALAGARFTHAAGLGLRYRVHGAQSLSRRNPRAFLDDCHRSITDVDGLWQTTGALDDDRRRGLVRCYGFLARSYFPLDRQRFAHVVQRLYELDPDYLPESPRHFRWLARGVGYARAERIAAWLRPVLRLAGF
jgi:glycosyltransferase involved in cell wall biosynthesis